MKLLLIIIAMTGSVFANDIIVKTSTCTVDETVTNLKHIIRNEGLGIFATINHSGNATMVDMKLNESKMVIFGNPRLGTALMQQDMTIGLDLPLRILVYKDGDEKVKMAYRDGTWLQNKHVINAPKKVAKVNNVMDKFTTEAGQCEKE